MLYSTSYNRSSTPAYDADSPERERPKLWLLSGLWNCNTDSSGSPELIYANPDAQTNLSPAICSYDQTEIYFSRYYDTGGSDKLDLATGQTTALLHPTDVMYTNDIRAALPNHKLLFCSDGTDGLHNYIMDTNTGTFEPYICTYQGNPFSLKAFQRIP